MDGPNKENPQFQKPTGEVRGSLRFLRDPALHLLVGETALGIGIIASQNIHPQPLRMAIVSTLVIAGLALAAFYHYKDSKRNQP